MEEPKNKYILLVDCVGYTRERNLLALGLTTKVTPTQVLRGELLEALPEAEQPTDVHRIALVGIERKSLSLECATMDLSRLSDEEASLLLAISHFGERYQTFVDTKRLDFGRRLSPGKDVLVEVKGFTKDIPGVVWFKGELPSCPGTMFGVELTMHPGQGNCDGTFRSKRYFTCPPDSGVFVGLDRLRPREDPDSNSPKRDENTEAGFKSRLRGAEDTQMAVEIPPSLEVGSMVEIPKAEGLPRYGVIRWIGLLPQVKDNLVAGIELEEELSSCSDGVFNGVRYFTCPAGRGFFTLLKHCFQDLRFAPYTPSSNTSLNSEKGEASSRRMRRSSVDSTDTTKAAGESSLTDPSAFIERQRQLLNEARLFKEKDQQEENSQRQLTEMEQRVKRMEEQLREKDRELEKSERLSSERQQKLTNFQRHLREIELQETSLHEQLREKGQQEQNVQKQLRELEQQLIKKNKERENLQDHLRVMEQRLREEEVQKENLQRRFREMEQELTNLQGQFRDKQEQVTTLERQLRVKDRQVNELEMTLSTAQQALNEHQRRQVTPDWVISRDQIQLTDRLLGRGGWGSVVAGKYCGCSVAVKQIHELILSPHNRSLFVREMNIASRCRHPCLLQFIGATNDEGSPLFVTELMESSLRALLAQKPLAAAEVSIISLDVARALNYLHQKKPAPIIHRDISSANVLLWRQGDQWRSKVSDYGTANFMQHTMTVGPGAAIYMAPEAQTSNQTVKVDVYSFGVLLCEMCIRELPDPERRDQQIAMVTDSLLRALIRGCVQQEPAARPNMEEIIEELEEPV